MAARFRTQHLHRFDAAGKAFLYLRSAAIFALDDVSRTILELLDTEPRAREEILAVLGTRWSVAELDEGLDELRRVQAIVPVNEAPQLIPKVIPLEPFPLTTMVMNVTN